MNTGVILHTLTGAVWVALAPLAWILFPVSCFAAWLAALVFFCWFIKITRVLFLLYVLFYFKATDSRAVTLQWGFLFVLKVVCMFSTSFVVASGHLNAPTEQWVSVQHEWNINGRLSSFSAVGRNDSPGSLPHHLLFQHHLHGQQPQPQQPQQSAGGHRHREPGQPGWAPDHGGVVLNPPHPHSNLYSSSLSPLPLQHLLKTSTERICNDLCY